MKNGSKSNLWCPNPSRAGAKRAVQPWIAESDERNRLCGTQRLRLEASARDFRPWQTVYGYFRRWSQDWTWNFIHDFLRDWLRQTEGRTVAPTAAIIDSQSFKTPDQAGESGYDAGKKIKGRKRHVAVDTLGLILNLVITSAAVQDRDAAKTLIKTLVRWFGRLQIIWADGGYLGSLVQWVKQLRPSGKLHLEIVRRCDRARGFKVLPKRWIVERTFGWLTKSRRLLPGLRSSPRP